MKELACDLWPTCEWLLGVSLSGDSGGFGGFDFSGGFGRTDIVRRVCEDGCVVLLCRRANTELF